jgi:hypothetical protein
MANSYVAYTGNGSQTDFTVTFPYIGKEHVKVYVSSALKSYEWLNETLIRISPAPAAAAPIIIRRLTPTDESVVTFTDDAYLTDADLNLLTQQCLYVLQEDIESRDEELAEFSGLFGEVTQLQADIAALQGQLEDADLYTRMDTAETDIGALETAVSALETEVDGKAAASHTQAISTITDLQTTLDGKSATNHTHAALVPAGAIMPFAMSTAPSGWLECNGNLVSRTTYAALFSAIGTTFGSGDGSSTFRLPDLRGEFIRGWAHGRSVDSGRTFGSSQADDFKSHNHNIDRYGDPHSTDGYQFLSSSSLGLPATTSTSIASQGGTETRPRNIALMYCIKT